MSKFSVGEIAIVVWSITGEGVNEEVEIKSEPFSKNGKLVHEVKFDDKYYGYFQPKHLRKKKPPQELGCWEDVEKIPLGINGEGWNPTKVDVNA